MGTHRYVAAKDFKRTIKENQALAIIDHLYNRDYRYQYAKDRSVNRSYLVYTLWRTGRRVSEVVGVSKATDNIDRCPGLRPIDFDEDNRTITFHILKKLPVRLHDKYGKERPIEKRERERRRKKPYTELIPYDDDYFDTMLAYIKAMDIPLHDRIFPYSRRSVCRFLTASSAALGMRLGVQKYQDMNTGKIYDRPNPVNAHSFRHGFSMHFLNQKKNDPRALPALQEILCHSSIEVTKSYLRFDTESKRRMLNEVFK